MGRWQNYFFRTKLQGHWWWTIACSELEVFQQHHKTDAGLHHSKPQADTIARSITESEERATWPLLDFFWGKPFRAKIVRLLIDVRVVMDGMYRNKNGHPLGQHHFGFGALVIFCYNSNEASSGWVFAERFCRRSEKSNKVFGNAKMIIYAPLIICSIYGISLSPSYVSWPSYFISTSLISARALSWMCLLFGWANSFNAYVNVVADVSNPAKKN